MNIAACILLRVFSEQNMALYFQVGGANIIVLFCSPISIRVSFGKKFRTNSINHIINEIKYNIKISAFELIDCWEFCFKDNGIGISKKHHNRIFKPFKDYIPEMNILELE